MFTSSVCDCLGNCNAMVAILPIYQYDIFSTYFLCSNYRKTYLWLSCINAIQLFLSCIMNYFNIKTRIIVRKQLKEIKIQTYVYIFYLKVEFRIY